MELGSQGFDDFLPVAVRRETPPRRASDAVFAIELDVEWVIDVTTGADGDADAVVERGVARWVGRLSRWWSALRFV